MDENLYPQDAVYNMANISNEAAMFSSKDGMQQYLMN